MRSVTALLLACGVSALGQTAPPDALRDLLISSRAHALEHFETRGATADLTLVKHRLREWIESRLKPITHTDEATVLAFQLNAELRKAGLLCDYFPEPNATECPGESLIGFLDEIRLRWDGGFLVVQTAVGIQCGNDESAYIYEWKTDHWQRFWESEQNNYTEKGYRPQYLQAVLISPTDYRPGSDETKHLVVTLGTNPWCTSNWQPIYYRIWLTRGGQPTLLLDESEFADKENPIQASVWPNDVLIEYAVVSLQANRRRQVRHYVLKHDTLERVDPFALRHWTSSPSGLRARRIRWQPPYRFSLVGVNDHPRADCTEEDPQADEFRTLFSDKVWY